ncbi:ATP-binding protein, partial [Salinivibrio kushneri]|uniref:ATP-binding protein n=1 Tax=Salinivibrio kushneri TaxID=1908198 RepID=UPI001A7E1338
NNTNDIRFMYFPVETEKDHKEVLENNSPLYKDRMVYKNQRRFDYYHWIQPFTIKSRSDSTAGVVCGFIDISERVKLLDQLSDAKENAESANVAKSRFLATMSHEIRTPINAILGLLELTKKKYSTDKFDIESVDVAYQAARELLSLIGDILDISKIESGKIDLTPDSNKLKDTIDSIYRTYYYLASQKGLSFDLEFDERLDRDFFYDDSRLKQVLVNIVGNAIKFTAKGRVDLRVRLIEDNRRYNKIEICLVDQGIGIPEKSMGRIFQAFNQADNHTGYGGTGLGLMISKAICDLMSASFNIESKEGIGTKITIQLDLEVSSENAESSTSHVNYEVGHDEKYSVLIVDDYAPNRLLLGEQLKYLGHTVLQDCNGKDAFDSYKNNVIDVVITDCNMPEVDGYELTRWIRYYEKEKSITPVVIIGYTANAQKEVIDDALASGMNSCLFKPITIDDLNTAISDVVFGGGELKESKDSFGNSWLDRDKLEALTLGNLELHRKILNEVFRENDSDILELRLALERLELEECKKIAHKMKSGSNMIGCTMISKKCDEIEGLCSEDEIAAYIEELITLTVDINKKIENELQSLQKF